MRVIGHECSNLRSKAASITAAGYFFNTTTGHLMAGYLVLNHQAITEGTCIFSVNRKASAKAPYQLLRSLHHVAMDRFTDSGSDSQPAFKPQNATAEDLLKSQTIGLVNLSDFRKRRAEAVEQKEREAHHDPLNSGHSGASSPSDRLF